MTPQVSSGPPSPPSTRRVPVSLVLAAACVLWGSGVVAGFKVVWNYEATPGAPADPPLEWPTDTRIERVPGRPTVIMLVHPRCSCTQASLTELNALMAQVHAPLAAYVLVAKPSGGPDGWEDTGVWARAHQIPGVTVLLDDLEEEARRFHAQTSGQTIAYDAGGRLLFSGGITLARGHEGDNAGRRRIVSLLTAGDADRRDSAVFGCPLADPSGRAEDDRSGSP